MFTRVARVVGVVLGVGFVSASCQPAPSRGVAVESGAGAMGVVSLTVKDQCPSSSSPRVTALGVWVDGRYDHELLLFPGTGIAAYDSLVGPLKAGRHEIEVRPSEFWPVVACTSPSPATVAVVGDGAAAYDAYRRAPVLELRADTVGEETDVPLYAYVETLRADGAVTWRYTVIFSNEDGGTPARALFARWGRTTDIEQVYEVTTEEGRITREDFQGPDHVVRPFKGRRRGEAPVLLVATLNNMVIDRGRGLVPVRPVPAAVDLSGATRESTMDDRAWVYRFMEAELEAEGRIVPDAPVDEQWVKKAPSSRDHVFLEAKVRLDRAVAVAWVQDRQGRRFWSHYDRPPLAIDRDGWVRAAVAAGADPGSVVAEAGWACLPAPDEKAGGSCEIEASRAFVLTPGYRPGGNLVLPARFTLKAGGEGRLRLAGAPAAGVGSVAGGTPR